MDWLARMTHWLAFYTHSYFLTSGIFDLLYGMPNVFKVLSVVDKPKTRPWTPARRQRQWKFPKLELCTSSDLFRFTTLSGAVDIFPFPPLYNVNWTFRSTPPLPHPLLNVHLKFFCPKSHCIPEGILICSYAKMSSVSSTIYCFQNVVETSYLIILRIILSLTFTFLLQNLHNCFFLSMLLIFYYTTVFS